MPTPVFNNNFLIFTCGKLGKLLFFTVSDFLDIDQYPKDKYPPRRLSTASAPWGKVRHKYAPDYAGVAPGTNLPARRPQAGPNAEASTWGRRLTPGFPPRSPSQHAR